MPLDREKLSDMKLKADLKQCQNDLIDLADAAQEVLALFPDVGAEHPALRTLERLVEEIPPD